MRNASEPTALLFPGQGSHSDDMRQVVARVRPGLLEGAIAALGDDPFERVDEGTAYLQPALYCASLARWADGGSPTAAYMAGHSLGELAALAAAGSVSEEDGLSLAIARGRAMAAAADSGAPGGMLAVLGDEAPACEIGERLGLTVANENAPGQLVLSGPVAALAAAKPELKRAGLKAVGLRVRGAFHSPAMESAVPEFKRALAAVDVRTPRVPVMSSIAAQPFDDVRARLVEALVKPVRWRQALIALHRAGVRRFVETGPGTVLTGLVRRTLDSVEATTMAMPGNPEVARA